MIGSGILVHLIRRQKKPSPSIYANYKVFIVIPGCVSRMVSRRYHTFFKPQNKINLMYCGNSQSYSSFDVRTVLNDILV